MQKTNTSKLGVVILTLAMLATAFAVLPTMGAGNATNENAPNAPTYPYITGYVKNLYNSQKLDGVEVTLYNNSWAVAPQITGESPLLNGQFNFTVEKVGNYTLTFTHPQFKEKTVYVINETVSDWTGIAADMGEVGMIKLSSVSGVVRNRAGTYLPDVAVTAVDTGTGLVDGETTTSSIGTFTVYADAANVNILFRKVGYYESQSAYALTQSLNTDAGTIYLDTIMPTPTVLLGGSVTNEATGADIAGAHISVSRDGVNWISNLTSDHGYYEILTYSGRFMVKAELKGYYTNESWADVPNEDRFNLNIEMKPTPPETFTLTGKVTEAGPLNVAGATVKLYDANGKYVNGTETDTNGDYTIKFYNATFRVSVSKEGYFTNSQWTITKVNATRDITLVPVPQTRTLSGRITTSDNFKIIGATVTIFDWNRTYSNSTVSVAPDGYYSIMAYQGTFAVLVDADGYQGKLAKVIVGSSPAGTAKNIALEESANDTIRTTYELSADWKNVTYRQNRTLSVDNATLRANADIEHGRGLLGLDVNNWDIDAAEVTAWTEYMEAQGLPDLYTTDTFALDNRHYELVTDTYTVTISDAVGSVGASTDAILVDIEATYTIMGTVAAGTSHSVSLNVSYDTEETDNVYDVVLPAGYEMVSNTTSSSFVKVTGFTTVTADTMVSTGTEKMTMAVEMSGNGTAKIRLTDGTYYEKNSTYEGYEVIVRMEDASDFNATVEFSAFDSTDPVGLIQLANFTWDFGDGSAPGYGMSATHNYTAAGTFKAMLNVTETGGNKTWHNATVLVDEAAPTAIVNVLYHTIASNAITINEDNKTSFTGANSTDMITGTTAGVVQTWQWSWGDGSANETVTKGGEANINHTYAEPGKYTLKLNVTDVVDHVSVDRVITVNVKDVTKPEANFQIMNSTYVVVTGCRENITFSFNSTSIDNYDSVQNLTYTWSWDDGSANETGMNLTHKFTRIGTFNVTLNVTDQAGNWGVRTTPVSISLGIRPNLILYANTFKIDPKTIDEGESVKFSVNVTNKGEANATGVTVKFYIRESDGGNKLISGTVTVVNEAGAAISGNLGINGTATAKLTWKPTGKGNYTIYVTANCTEEHSSTLYDNNNGATLATSYVKVNESPMTQIIIVVIAVVAFVVIGAIYFFWMRGKNAGGSMDDKRKKK